MNIMDSEITTLSRARELPDYWDSFAVDYFQTREFLYHAEKYNPCKQRYYVLSQNGIFRTGAVVYSLKPDLLTYLSIPSPFRMNIAGIPCSVSSDGVIGSRYFFQQLIEYIKIREKGLLLVLNMEPDLPVKEMVCGKTLPTVIIINRFHSWETYIKSLKTNYRRRVRQLSVPFSGILKKEIPCSGFDNQMYTLYLEVLKHSKGKLETLSLEFFQHLPSNFKLTTFYYSEKLIGWYISVTFKEKFYFFLGGIDYQLNKQYKTYLNILLAVVKEGIESNALIIDLGQTAEIPKVRLGGRLVQKTMMGYHSNPILRNLLKAGKKILEYSVNVPEPHVFKEII